MPQGERPGWLVNVTNDGWFGISSGPFQHFQQARVLAIAEGLPLVRAANTGISAVIDPVGRLIGALPLGIEGVLDSRLPAAIEPTIYSRYGSYFLILLLVGSVVIVGTTQTSRIDCAVKQYNMKLLCALSNLHAHRSTCAYDFLIMGKLQKIDGLFTLNFPITENSHIAFARSLVTTTRKIGGAGEIYGQEGTQSDRQARRVRACACVG